MRRAFRELVGLYWDSGVSADISALAWYLLASLVPLALGLTALTAVVLGDYAQAQALAERVSRVLPKDVHDQVVTLVLRTKRAVAVFGDLKDRRARRCHGPQRARVPSGPPARLIDVHCGLAENPGPQVSMRAFEHVRGVLADRLDGAGRELGAEHLASEL